MSFEELPYFMTTKQLADVTGEHEGSITRGIREGRIPADKVNGRGASAATSCSPTRRREPGMTEGTALNPRCSLADALARVPAELKAEARRVCWRREERIGSGGVAATERQDMRGVRGAGVHGRLVAWMAQTGFLVSAQKCVVRVFGLGTGAFDLWVDASSGKVRARRYDARKMVPLTWGA